MISRNLMVLKRRARATWHWARPKMTGLLLRGSVIGLLCLAILQEQIVLQISIRYPTFNSTQENVGNTTLSFENAQTASVIPIKLTTESAFSRLNLANEATAVSEALSPEEQAYAAQFSNLGFVMNPDYAHQKNIDPKVVAYKQQKCADYIQKYLKIAQEEASLYNIPVAITLAQGLLESNAGDSKLAQKENNHFGIKCTNKCTDCRCANYTDDSRYDMFRVFKSPWFSFREHSKLLQGKRYKHLLELPRTDYRNWAYGLQAAGYATDKKYAEKLVKIIENLNLSAYDENE